MAKRTMVLLIIVCSVTAAIISALVTQFIVNNTYQEGEIYIAGEEYNLLLEYFEMGDIGVAIEEFYYEDVDISSLALSAKQGMVHGLNDSISAYYTPDEFEVFDENALGSYISLGMMLEEDYSTGYKRVERLFSGTPAESAGISEGDLIMAIDGTDTRGMDIDFAVSMIRGVEGTTVELSVRTANSEEPFTLTRETRDIQVAFSDMLDADIGIIEIMEFSGSSVADVQRAMDSLDEDGAQAIILDLRGTPGGYISQASELADNLLESAVITYTQNKAGEQIYTESDDEWTWSKPVCVIVDENTRGVAEVFAAALQENGRAKVVGVTTAGLGGSPELIDLPNTGAGLKLITSQFYTPGGNLISENGITPDIHVELDMAIVESGAMTIEQDAQLQAAADVLREELG